MTGQLKGITPVAASDLTRKDYVDGQVATRLTQTAADARYVNLTGDTMTGQLKGITPVAAADLTRKDYVDGVSSLASNGYQKLPGGLVIQWGTNTVVVNAGGDGDINYPVAFNSLFTILVSDGDGVTNLGVVNSSILSKFTFRSQTPSVAIRCNWIAVGIFADGPV